MLKFEELPEEITLRIFRFLPQSCLQNCINDVCQKWSRISKDNSLYHHMYFDSKLSLRKILKIIARYSAIVQRIVINGRNDTDEILRIVSLCENLRHLALHSCRSSAYACGRIFAELNAQLVSAILEHNHQLQVLEITSSAVQNGSIRLLGCNLEKLVIKSEYYYRMIEESQCLSQNKLKMLNLQGLIISRETLYNIILDNQKTLETIKLDVWQPQLGSYDRIIEAISACSNLTKLLLRNVAFYCVSDDSFSLLTRFQKLSTIVFSKIEKVSPQAYVTLFKQPQSKFLDKIILNTCDGVNGLVIRTIAEHCPALKKFGVHQSKTAEVNLIQPEDVLFLASKCTKLELLDLCYTHQSIGKAIPSVILLLPNLKKFKFCEYLGNDPKVLLTSLYNVINRNAKNFCVDIERNLGSDEYIIGVRKSGTHITMSPS